MVIYFEPYYSATGALSGLPSKPSRRFRPVRSRHFLKMTFLTAQLAVQRRSRKWLPGLHRCTISTETWTHEFVPCRVSLSSGGVCRFLLSKWTFGHHLQPRLWHLPIVHPVYRLGAPSKYLRSYCQNVQSLLMYIFSAKEVLSCPQFLCSSFNQKVPIIFNLTASLLRYTTHSYLIPYCITLTYLNRTPYRNSYHLNTTSQ